MEKRTRVTREGSASFNIEIIERMIKARPR
jgi:hypothetical protein